MKKMLISDNCLTKQFVIIFGLKYAHLLVNLQTNKINGIFGTGIIN